MKRNDLFEFISDKKLLIVIIIAFAIRMIFFMSLQPWKNEVVENRIIIFDAGEYNDLALSLLSQNSFENFDSFRTPGYPVFVAILYLISSKSVWFVLIIQIIINTLSAVLVFKIALLSFSRRIALLSSFIFAVDVHQALYSIAILNDVLFEFLFLVSVYYLYKAIKICRLDLIIISALFLGIATLVRPISFLFPFIVVFFIIIINSLRTTKKLLYSISFIFIFIVTISPWLIRNYKQFGELKLTSINGYNLLFYNVASTEVYKSGRTLESVRKYFNEIAIKQGCDTLDNKSFKSSKIYSDIAKKYIKENFILYCKRHIMGIINMYAGLSTKRIASTFNLKSTELNIDQFSGPNIIIRMLDFFRTKTKGEIIIGTGLVFYLLFNYSFALFAIYFMVKNNEQYVYLSLLIIIYFSMLVGVVGLTRYRIPFMPLINILCSTGFIYITKEYNIKSK